MELKINPEYEALLPKLSSEEYEALKQSIKDEGQHFPIIINEEKQILDGHNRYKICQELSIEPKIETKTFPIKLIEKKFVIEANLRRRHLNEFQRCEMAMPLLEIEQQLSARTHKATIMPKGTKGFQPALLPNESSVNKNERVATAKVARTAGVSRSTFERAKKIIEKGSEETKKKTRSGQQSINSAYTKVREAERQARVNATLKEKNRTIPENINLIAKDFTSVTEIPSDSVQLILTDPPYGEEFLGVWEDLGRFAKKVLVPGGFLIAYCPQFHLPFILDALGKSLDYFWIMVLILPKHRLVHSRNVFCNWKPLIIFNKAPRINPQFFGDVIQGHGMEKELHEWQQGEKELEQIIETFCPQDGIVLDPMAGTGTTIAVAKRLKRKAIGIEKDLTVFEKMKVRITT